MEENKKITFRDLILPIVLTLILAGLIGISLIFGGGGAGEGGGVTANPDPKSKELFGEGGELYFNTSCRFIDYGGLSGREFSALSELIEEKLGYYHKLFDIYHTYDGITNIKSLNDRAGEGAVEISPELFEFLEYSAKMYTLTSGEVNIAMGAVLKIWHNYREEGILDPDAAKIPEMTELSAAVLHTDINNLVLDKENMTAELSDPEMSLDVGAIAKGYAAEKIAEALAAAGYTAVVLDLGGNLRAVGTKPNGGGWETGVRNPGVYSGSYLHKFTLSDGSAVTSGNYERYYTVNGKNYHHVIDKDTLMPSEHFTSVTVITKHSGLADALSTALFNMTYEEGKALVGSLEDVKVVWLTKDGEIRMSE